MGAISIDVYEWDFYLQIQKPNLFILTSFSYSFVSQLLREHKYNEKWKKDWVQEDITFWTKFLYMNDCRNLGWSMMVWVKN